MPSQSQPSGAPNEARSPASRLLVALILVAPALVIAAYWALAIAPSKHSLPPALPQHATPAIQPGPRSAQSPASPDGTPAAGVPGDAEAMAMRLAARLEREPQDANGWRTLARTWYVMARFPEAVAAYEKLAALGPLDADVLADYADATAMAQGSELTGAPMELVHRALALNPAQWKALSIAATDAFRRNDTPAAIAYWERALAAVPADSPMAGSIRASLAEARRSSP